MKNPLFLFAFLFILRLHAQSPWEEKMQNYYVNYLPEKVFVHTDKNIYAGGESVWMAVYLVDGQTHRPGTFSNTVRVELHDGKGQVVAKQKLRSLDGHTSGELQLPATIVPGDYQLTAFTNYQRNEGEELLFRKTIRILSGLKESGGVAAPTLESMAALKKVPEKVKLRFFPEGGDCINGAFCRVALVAESENGQPVSMDAILMDEEGAEVAELKTDESGMGSFVYQPAVGKQYKATINTSKDVFELPPALDEGFSLSVIPRKEEIRISLKTNRSEGLTGSRIVVHLRGFVLVDQVISNEKQEAVLKLPRVDLDAGVYVATLFDPIELPVAERLFFVAPTEEESTLLIKTDQSKYTKRQAVNMELLMNMGIVGEDSLAKGRISVSVLPEKSTGGPSGDDIRTWLMLNSDLDRPISNTPELIKSNDPKVANRKIDEFLLTRGWRRFVWEMTGSPDDFTPDRLLEKGVFLRGRMGKYNSPEKPQPGKVSLTRSSIGYMEEIDTDEQGHFAFGPYAFNDTIDVLLQGRYEKGKKKGGNTKTKPFTHLEILPYDSPKLLPIPFEIQKKKKVEQIDSYTDLSQEALTVARNFDSLIITLDVVDVKSKRISKKEEERNERTFMYGGKPDSRLEVATATSNLSLGIFDLFRKLPGVRVIGAPGSERIEMRGQTSIILSSEPAYYLDGYQIDLTYVRTLQTFNIDFIDVIRGNRAAFLGSDGTNGALLIYTKQGPELAAQNKPGVLNAQINGYHKARQFAVFDPTATGNQNRPDLRTTIHWNADLRIDETGSLKEVFKTSDQKGKFVIVAQGLRNDGQPFYGVSSYEVE